MALKRLNPYDEVLDSLVEKYGSDYKKLQKSDTVALGTERLSKAQFRTRWSKMNQAQRMSEIRKHGVDKIMKMAAPNREVQNGR